MLALVLLPACHFDLPQPATKGVPDEGNTIGDQGKVELTYAGSGEACISGCMLSMPLMVGDDEPITIVPHDTSPLPSLAFKSTDASIFDVTPAIADGSYPWQRGVTLKGHAAGSATLEISDATTHDLLDTATVHVAAATSVSVSFQLNGSPTATPSTPTQLVLSVGQEADASFDAIDAEGEHLAAWNGVSLAVGDTDVAAVEHANITFVTAQQAGQTTITAHAGAATQVISLVVK